MIEPENPLFLSIPERPQIAPRIAVLRAVAALGKLRDSCCPNSDFWSGDVAAGAIGSTISAQQGHKGWT
jgi:hypothetical protein